MEVERLGEQIGKGLAHFLRLRARANLDTGLVLTGATGYPPVMRFCVYAFNSMLCLIASTSLKVKYGNDPLGAESAHHLSDARANPLSAGAQSNPVQVCANMSIVLDEGGGI